MNFTMPFTAERWGRFSDPAWPQSHACACFASDARQLRPARRAGPTES